MDECWAQELGDCSGKITQEHTVSEGVFITGLIRVQTKAESSENKQKFNELINRWTNQLPDEEFRKAFSHMTPEERNTLASLCYAKCKPAPLTGKPGRPGKIWTR